MQVRYNTEEFVQVDMLSLVEMDKIRHDICGIVGNFLRVVKGL